jgi:CubicO group peptidase (beta-lactamase class C family)
MGIFTKCLTAGLLVAFGFTASPTNSQADETQYSIDCEAAASASRRARGIAVVVVHRGDVLCEAYAPGVEASDSWELASGVKSFTGVIAAAAVQDGLLTLDELVVDTITEWGDDPRRSQITIRHLLNQSSGLGNNAGGRLLPSYADAISQRAVDDPGSRFRYGPQHFAVFGEVIRRKLAAAGLDETPLHYLSRRVLLPLNIYVERWGSIDGMPTLSENGSITPMNWARFGFFVQQGGRIDGMAMVDGPTLEAMFEPSDANSIYGLSWWLPHPDNASDRLSRRMGRMLDTVHAAPDFPSVAIAAGAGGQRLYILPELELVVVRMTRGVRQDPQSRRADWSDRRFLERLLVPVETDTD